MPQSCGFLVKLAHTPGAAVAARPQLGAAAGVTLRKLFDATPPAAATAALAAPQHHAWYVAETNDAAFGAAAVSDNPWDRAHAMVGNGLAIDGSPDVIAVEPDFVQPPFLDAGPQAQPLPLAARSDPNTPDPQKADPYAPGPGFAWHLRPEFSGLAAARDSLGLSLDGPQSQSSITIVHLDTGFDPDHKAAPAFIKQQKNLVERNSPTARDETPDHAWDQRAHGTGTLGILAGRRLAGTRPASGEGVILGAAAPMQIVPVRIANTVYHIRTSTVAEGLSFATQIGADVVSMSMGGLPSSAWADAVNTAYENGVVVVCAAGNNFGGLPTSLIVYPARFGRVVAACGVMANRTPYFHLPLHDMEGNVGPATKMRTALAAFTPNIPWARLGTDLIDEDGGGTSAATPQIAAAAALWLHKNGNAYPARDWRRAEAARRALLDSADLFGTNSGEPSPYYGRGLLRAQQALTLTNFPDLAPTPPDTANFAFLRLLTSVFGISTADRHADMLALELTQIALQSREAQKAIPDPDLPAGQITEAQRRRFFEVILAEPAGSRTLNRFLERELGRGGPARSAPAPAEDARAKPAVPLPRAASATRQILPPPPPNRRLRIFATDPGDATRLQTAFINTATVELAWERTRGVENLLRPGPVGEYVEVVDVDPASGLVYPPVDLNHPFLLAQDGLCPAEGNPQFHQQMTYAVAMRTIGHFEVALGRRVLWAARRLRFRDAGTPGERDEAGAQTLPAPAPAAPPARSEAAYVQRLRIYPHALRQANAYYSPEKMALLFGYFPVPNHRHLVFTCLSHDVVAHETTHAVLDGLHRRYQEPTNPDVLAFHEGFADIVAIFQHFTFPELLRHEIQNTRGDMLMADLLGGLAREFGQALGHTQALRNAINRTPDPGEYANATEAHDRGAILVSAVFDAFIAIYMRRTTDLLRIATGGSGILRPGALDDDLVARLAAEATKTARHVMTICIRALDYMPPVDPTFPEYLRALITADSDLVANDRFGYRVAFLEAFGRRGIQPDDLRTLSVQSLRWQTLRAELQPEKLGDFLRKEIDLSWDIGGDRRTAYDGALRNARSLHQWLANFFETATGPETARALGLDASIDRFEVHSVRPARRTSPEGQVLTDLVAIITQHREVTGCGMLRGGCTLILDRREDVPPIRYAIIKPVWNDRRAQRIAAYQGVAPALTGLHAMYFGHLKNEPFALVHSDI